MAKECSCCSLVPCRSCISRHMGKTPLPGIVKKVQPGSRAVGGKLRGCMGVLPPQEAALRVGHERQVAPIQGAQGRNAPWGPVGVGRVGLCGLALCVAIPARVVGSALKSSAGSLWGGCKQFPRFSAMQVLGSIGLRCASELGPKDELHCCSQHNSARADALVNRLGAEGSAQVAKAGST